MKVKYPKVKWYGNRGVMKFSDGEYYYRGFYIKRDDYGMFDARYKGKTHLKPKYLSCLSSSVSKLVDEIDHLYQLTLDELALKRSQIRFKWYTSSTI